MSAAPAAAASSSSSSSSTHFIDSDEDEDDISSPSPPRRESWLSSTKTTSSTARTHVINGLKYNGREAIAKIMCEIIMGVKGVCTSCHSETSSTGPTVCRTCQFKSGALFTTPCCNTVLRGPERVPDEQGCIYCGCTHKRLKTFQCIVAHDHDLIMHDHVMVCSREACRLRLRKDTMFCTNCDRFSCTRHRVSCMLCPRIQCHECARVTLPLYQHTAFIVCHQCRTRIANEIFTLRYFLDIVDLPCIVSSYLG